MRDWLPRFAAAAALLVAAAAGAASPPVMLADLTSPELAARIAAGTTTVLVPVGGTEQSGPHLVLGKHNRRVEVLAARIAERLGNAVVAPVIAYVPEGAVNPPAGHMRYSGTISVPDAAFEGVLEGAARSLRQHGFRDVILLGDHGGYQKNLERVAVRLNREFATSAGNACRVVALTEYYRVTQTDYIQALKAHGATAAEIGEHAGLADTALALAVDPALVRAEALANAAGKPGVSGDPRRANAELGRLGSETIVDVSAAAIAARVRAHAEPPLKEKRTP